MDISREKPDFSGDWVLDRQASTLSSFAEGIRSAVARIEHHDPTFRYKATFVSETGQTPVEYELLSNGPEAVSTHQGTTIVSSLTWEGQALVGTWHIQRPDVELKITFRHELVDGGRRLRMVEQLRGGGRDQENVWSLERQ